MSSTDTKSETTAECDEGARTVAAAVEQIGSEWRLVTLYHLASGEMRFNELKRAADASSRTLSRVLDDLEDADLVHRRVEDRPIATYYSLTEKGEALRPVFEDIESWADDWL